MSDMKRALQALAIARSTEATEAVLAVYLHLLRDLDAHHVSRACERLAMQPRLEYQAALPEAGLIRAEVANVAREDRQAARMGRIAQHSHRDDDPTTWVYCKECKDTSYRQFRCDGGTGETGDRDAELRRVPCARRRGHYPHTYAERCACYETNPVIEEAWYRAHPGAKRPEKVA